MTQSDLFHTQQLFDRFRAALGQANLRTSAPIDAMLARADQYGWTPERLATVTLSRLAHVADAGVGLMIQTAHQLSNAPEPPPPTEHQLAAAAKAKPGPFRQPLRPCGECDGTPARWLDVTPKHHRGQAIVMHCPVCWTPPPGYQMPEDRIRAERRRLVIDAANGTPPPPGWRDHMRSLTEH